MNFKSLNNDLYLLIEKYQYDAEDKLIVDESDYGFKFVSN